VSCLICVRIGKRELGIGEVAYYAVVERGSKSGHMARGVDS